MQADELEAEIFRYLEKKLRVKPAELSREAPLISGGLVDSGNLVRLATHLERLTGVSIPDRDIDADHFDSVDMILAYIAHRQGG
jgi:acyl carrier protein